jgi:hypothetical protein
MAASIAPQKKAEMLVRAIVEIPPFKRLAQH